MTPSRLSRVGLGLRPGAGGLEFGLPLSRVTGPGLAPGSVAVTSDSPAESDVTSDSDSPDDEAGRRAPGRYIRTTQAEGEDISCGVLQIRPMTGCSPAVGIAGGGRRRACSCASCHESRVVESGPGRGRTLTRDSDGQKCCGEMAPRNLRVMPLGGLS